MPRCAGRIPVAVYLIEIMHPPHRHRHRPRRRRDDPVRGRRCSAPCVRWRSAGSIRRTGACRRLRLPTALAFALYPLGRAREVSPTALFRDQVAPVRKRPPPAILSRRPRPPALAGLGDRPCLRSRIAAGLRRSRPPALPPPEGCRLGRRWRCAGAPRSDRPMLRLAVGNIHRPGALTPSVVLSLGLACHPRRARPHRRQFPARVVRPIPATRRASSSSTSRAAERAGPRRGFRRRKPPVPILDY